MLNSIDGPEDGRERDADSSATGEEVALASLVRV